MKNLVIICTLLVTISSLAFGQQLKKGKKITVIKEKKAYQLVVKSVVSKTLFTATSKKAKLRAGDKVTIKIGDKSHKGFVKGYKSSGKMGSYTLQVLGGKKKVKPTKKSGTKTSTKVDPTLNNPKPTTKGVEAEEVKIAELEIAVIEEINEMRANPKAYAKKLKEYEQYIQKHTTTTKKTRIIFDLPNENPLKVQKTYPDDLKEAIAVLEATDSLSTIALDSSLYKAAKEHSEAPVVNSHFSIDGSSPGERAKKQGYKGSVSECMLSDKVTAQGIVLKFIVDHKVLGRQHRKNLLNPDNKAIAVGCGLHIPETEIGKSYIRTVIVCGR